MILGLKRVNRIVSDLQSVQQNRRHHENGTNKAWEQETFIWTYWSTVAILQHVLKLTAPKVDSGSVASPRFLAKQQKKKRVLRQHKENDCKGGLKGSG